MSWFIVTVIYYRYIDRVDRDSENVSMYDDVDYELAVHGTCGEGWLIGRRRKRKRKEKGRRGGRGRG